jgi:hypothetical protein
VGAVQGRKLVTRQTRQEKKLNKKRKTTMISISGGNGGD